MAIEKIRFGARLRVHEEIQELETLTPAIAAQPLVEKPSNTA